jgi:hypothetical protein
MGKAMGTDSQSSISPLVSYIISNFGRNLLCLPPDFTLVSCLAYLSTLKAEPIYSSETSVYFQWTTRRYIPEDTTLQVPSKFVLLCCKKVHPRRLWFENLLLSDYATKHIVE